MTIKEIIKKSTPEEDKILFIIISILLVVSITVASINKIEWFLFWIGVVLVFSFLMYFPLFSESYVVKKYKVLKNIRDNDVECWKLEKWDSIYFIEKEGWNDNIVIEKKWKFINITPSYYLPLRLLEDTDLYKNLLFLKKEDNNQFLEYISESEKVTLN